MLLLEFTNIIPLYYLHFTPTIFSSTFLQLMPSQVLHFQAAKLPKDRPVIEPGYTVRVHQKVQEGDKERVQIFEGLVIAVHNGHTLTDRSFTVRKVVDGVGVERVFPWLSPIIVKIEVKKVAQVRRAKLNFLRGRSGKSARINERFTNADEFQVAVAPAPVKEEVVATVAPDAEAK
jgi:large subunit ribosomal protein L19